MMANTMDSSARTPSSYSGYESMSPPLAQETRFKMSSQSPVDHNGNHSGGSGYGSGQSENGRGALSASLNFLKSLTEKKNTRDGKPSKKRGPKPDSKPAMTRRQELNRQAQRTHRERKELYIKALEEEILGLKEKFHSVTKDKDVLAEENRQLKQLLAQHGITWTGTGGVDELTNNIGIAYSSTGSNSAYGPGSQSISPQSNINHSSFSNSMTTPGSTDAMGHGGSNFAQQSTQPGIDYDQAGIDFVLTLERPCMDHLQILVDRSQNRELDSSGVALMASCPPGIIEDPSHFGHALMASCPTEVFEDYTPEIPPGHGVSNPAPGKQWDMSKSDLANLLDLSKRLNLDGEITPVMAWGMILEHSMFPTFSLQDFHNLTVELKAKTRCHGFGAVLEEFELRDSLESLLSQKPGAHI